MPDAPRTHRRSAGRRRHFVVRRTPWSGQLPASRLCCRRGHRVRRPGSTAVADGRAGTVGRRRPPCPCSAQGSRGRGGEQPSGQHPAALPDVRRTLPRGVRFRGHPWVPGQVGAAGGHRRPGRSDSGRGLRTPATRRRPARWTPATAAGARGRCGSGLLDSRQRNRPLPLGCPAGNGTARCGIGQHRHGQTARSVVGGDRKPASSCKGSAAQESQPLR